MKGKKVIAGILLAGILAVTLAGCKNTDNTKEETDKQDGNILQGMRFLCAEDNELNAEILTELLKIEVRNVPSVKMAKRF